MVNGAVVNVRFASRYAGDGVGVDDGGKNGYWFARHVDNSMSASLWVMNVTLRTPLWWCAVLSSCVGLQRKKVNHTKLYSHHRLSYLVQSYLRRVVVREREKEREAGVEARTEHIDCRIVERNEASESRPLPSARQSPDNPS